MRRYYDYSKIIEISTAAALVLAAEYDRFRRLCNSVPPTINLGDWPAPFFRTLYEVGFFEIVGLAEDVAERYRTNEGKRIMRIVSGKDAAEVTAAAEGIADLSGFLDEEEPLNASVRLALNSSLGEAMINVARHAYPEDEIMSVPHVNRWWVTASADRRKNELTVVIFDQGASIPVTFPRKELGDSIVGFLAKVLGTGPKHAFSDDGAYIAAALLPGRTQTNQVNRGLGLPEMKDLIDVCGGGELCIISRGGTCRYDIETNIQRTSSPHSIGGTLVQWRLEVGRAGA